MMVPDDILDGIDPEINYIEGLFDSIQDRQQSKYVDVSKMNDNISNYKGYLSIMNYNIRSFRTNSDCFFNMFRERSAIPNILCLTETWFTEEYKEEIDGFSSSHVIRPLIKSGGVSLYIENKINFQVIPSFCKTTTNIELNCVEINVSNHSIFILGIYRPHSGTVSEFCGEITEIFEGGFFNGKTCVLLGDFNINLLSEENNVSNFINVMHSFHFLPLITKPTRFGVNNVQPSLLDHVWFNSISFEYICNIVLNDITDHCPILFQVNLNNDELRNDEKIQIKFRLNNDETRNEFRISLSNFNWTSIKSNDVNTYYENYLRTLNTLYCSCFPIKIKYISKKQYLKPWITPNIHNLISLKSKYFHLLKLGMVSKSENNQFKNRVKLIIQKSKNKYYNDYFLRNRNNLKDTWKMLRNLTSTNQSHNSIKNIVVNGNILSSDTEIAETFNEYFCQLPCNLENNLPLSSVDPLSYLNIPPSPTLSQFDPVSPTEINIICKGLKKSKQGFDHITVPLFNSTLDIHSFILCEIINLAFTSGIFPNMLKISRIIPIFKKGDRKEISNYRPISILPFISKVFEKCMHSRIIGHFSFYNLFSPRQYGFMRNKCTEDATLELVENLYINKRK